MTVIMKSLIISMKVIMINFAILMFRELQADLFHNVDPKVSRSLLVIIALSTHNADMQSVSDITDLSVSKKIGRFG